MRVGPVGGEAEDAVGDGAGDAALREIVLDLGGRDAGRGLDTERPRAARGVRRAEAREAAVQEAALEGVVVRLDVREDGAGAELEDQVE